ncbi:MAG TPA: 16S rRNA (guanine(966)-N(2))-methyltransferase RsmD [Candidatus Polarisedimenticolia bacterium]|jgi:16S rRNA (guanine966-N2)-methyltransferase|nr:16S rRNA (guanine(966)-N(2))-methyltransferase RsmD [Candidatus Polarisedimenticolia bacterium]
MGNLRVIGGEKRGFSLASPPGFDVRPTSARVREALFDILAGEIPGAGFLELYAGTGAVGIEALSRGARRCVFVEASHRGARAIRDNLEACGFRASGRVIAGPLPAALRRVPTGEAFDIAFLDPPYGDRGTAATLDALGGWEGLSREGRLVLEHRKSWEPPRHAGTLVLRRSVRYGDTVLSFYDRRERPAARRKV